MAMTCGYAVVRAMEQYESYNKTMGSRAIHLTNYRLCTLYATELKLNGTSIAEGDGI